MSEEDVTISKQTFMVVLNHSEDIGANSFVTLSLVMPYFLWKPPLKCHNTIIKVIFKEGKASVKKSAEILNFSC